MQSVKCLNEFNLDFIYSPSGLGCGMALMIFSIWLMVDVPGNRAFPSSISPRIQPRLHMSTPFVYLRTRCTKQLCHFPIKHCVP